MMKMLNTNFGMLGEKNRLNALPHSIAHGHIYVPTSAKESILSKLTYVCDQHL